MARTKKQQIMRYVVYPILTLGLISLAAYVLVVRSLQIRNQKQQFEKAEKQLDALATQIEQTIGKPDDIKKEKNCDRANLKSSKGPLSCSVGIRLFFAGRSSQAATDIMKAVSDHGSGELKLLGKMVDSFVPSTSYGGDQNISQKFSDIGGLSCGAQYIYPVTPRLDQAFKPTQDENLEVSLSCSESAITQFYPLRD